MPELRQLAHPRVQRSESPSTYQARWRLLEEVKQLRSSQHLADNNLTGRINCVNLKHVLCQIEIDCANILTEGSFARVCITATYLGT
jgi:hypothetical protein